MDNRIDIFESSNVIEIIKNKFEMCTNVVNKTSISETVTMEIKGNKLRRKSYAREFKLTVVTCITKMERTFIKRRGILIWIESKFITG